MKRVLNWTHACVCGMEPERQSRSRPRSSRTPVESAGEPVSLPAKALAQSSSVQSVHHKDNVTLSAGLGEIYRTHSCTPRLIYATAVTEF